ncbi:unnamed protein product, partial [Ascophyllum nodosum]
LPRDHLTRRHLHRGHFTHGPRQCQDRSSRRCVLHKGDLACGRYRNDCLLVVR